MIFIRRNIAILFAAILVTACQTTVISDEDRELPPEPDVMEDMEEMADEIVEEMEDELEELEEEMEDMDSDDMDDMEEGEEVSSQLEADLSQSFIAFTGSKGSAVSHEGKFNSFNVTIDGADDMSTAVISLSIDVDSMETDSDGLTNHLNAPDFFDSATYPTATFTSSSIVSNGDDSYTVTGLATIKGVEKEVSFDAVITSSYLTMNYDLDRTMFGVGGPADGVTSVDASVPVEAKIVFQ